MIKTYSLSMQGLPIKPERGKDAAVGRVHFAVKRIADQRMADRFHMDANLVRAPGFKAAFDKGRRVQPLMDLPMGDRAFALTVRNNGDFFAVDGGPGQRAGDRSGVAHGIAGDNRLISAVNAMLGKLCGQPNMRGIGLGDDHEARRAFVNPVDNAGPRDTADTG